MRRLSYIRTFPCHQKDFDNGTARISAYSVLRPTYTILAPKASAAVSIIALGFT